MKLQIITRNFYDGFGASSNLVFRTDILRKGMNPTVLSPATIK